jgi:hypothetical protein
MIQPITSQPRSVSGNHVYQRRDPWYTPTAPRFTLFRMGSSHPEQWQPIRVFALALSYLRCASGVYANNFASSRQMAVVSEICIGIPDCIRLGRQAAARVLGT